VYPVYPVFDVDGDARRVGSLSRLDLLGDKLEKRRGRGCTSSVVSRCVVGASAVCDAGSGAREVVSGRTGRGACAYL
jgi:hypothetical protein